MANKAVVRHQVGSIDLPDSPETSGLTCDVYCLGYRGIRNTKIVQNSLKAAAIAGIRWYTGIEIKCLWNKRYPRQYAA